MHFCLLSANKWNLYYCFFIYFIKFSFTSIVIQHLDININKNATLQELGIEKYFPKIVCFVGKLTNFKGVDVLLDAVSLYENNETLTLIAGDGELRSTLEEQCKKLCLKNVVFLGNQPQNILKKIYNIADCSVVPSRREPFGLVAAEALICGAPVVATNQGGLPDFVTPDVGILVNVDDSQALAGAIKSILNKEKSFDRLKSATKIKTLYSQDSLINQFESLYIKSINK